MKKLLFIFLFQACAASLMSQVLKKYPIGESNCSAYFYCDPGKFEVQYSDDSSKMYIGECVNEETSYGIICVNLLQPVSDLSAAEDLLVAYLDFLKTSFKITSSAGYGKGHRLKNSEATRGVLDYWGDDEKNNWKVKGWTNGKILAVLYAYSKKELPESKVNLYLESLSFGEK